MGASNRSEGFRKSTEYISRVLAHQWRPVCIFFSFFSLYSMLNHVCAFYISFRVIMYHLRQKWQKCSKSLEFKETCEKIGKCGKDEKVWRG